MATSSTAQSIAAPKKRVRGLAITLRALTDATTPLATGCFYAAFLGLTTALFYPLLTGIHLDSLIVNNPTFASIMGAPHLTSFSGLTAYLALQVYSSFYSLIFGGFVAYIGGAAIPINIENGTLDLALSRPIGRIRYYLETWLSVLIGGLIIGLLTVLCVWLGALPIKNPGLDWQWIWITQLVQFAFLFFSAGVGMLIGSFINASRSAGGAAVGIIVLGYLLNTFGGLSDKLSWLLKISPYYYAPAIEPLILHQLTWWHPWLLLLAGLVCTVGGLFIFQKRDLPTV